MADLHPNKCMVREREKANIFSSTLYVMAFPISIPMTFGINGQYRFGHFGVFLQGGTVGT